MQDVIDIRYDCDADTLLVLVDQTGVACHTGERSCFYRSLRASALSQDETAAHAAKEEDVS